MSGFKNFLRAVVISAAAGAALALAPVAPAAAFVSGGFHGGGGFSGGFHGGGGMHGGAFRASGIRGGFRRNGIGPAADFRGRHHYGYWRNGVWIGIWPGYYGGAYDAEDVYGDGDAYDDSSNYYCDPDSPYFNPDYCRGN